MRTQARRVRFIALLAGTAVILGTLSGCASIVGFGAHEIAQTAKQIRKDADEKKEAVLLKGAPAAGDCWHGTFSETRFADWFGSKPLSCALPHQFYSYAVQKLTEKHTGAEFVDGVPNSSVFEDADAICADAAISKYGNFGKLDERIGYKTFVPKLVQWNAGARWVRCDINVVAIGSSIASPRLENLPSSHSIAQLVRAETKAFNFCSNDPGHAFSAGPRAQGAVFASCGDRPDWTLVGRVNISGTNTSFPSTAALARVNHDDCTAYYPTAASIIVATDPTKKQWSDGDHLMDCWSHPKAD